MFWLALIVPPASVALYLAIYHWPNRGDRP